MFRVLFLMLLLLAGLVAGPYLAGSQGYVRIETDSKVIEMSLVMLVVFFIMAMSMVYIIEWTIIRFFRLSKGSYSWFFHRKQKQAQQETLEGLMKFREGDYSKAEKLFSKNAKHAGSPILNLIKAAEAAQQRGDEFNANKYLIEASQLSPNSVVVELTRAKILVQQNKLPAARSAIDSLIELAPRNTEVLRLAIDIYKQSKAFNALDAVLENVGQNSFLSTEEYIALEHFVNDGLLDEKMNEEGQDGLLTWWENQPSRIRKYIYVRTGLIQRLIDTEDHESAEQIALETFKKYEDKQLLSLLKQLTRIQVAEDSKLVKTLIKRADKAEECYRDDYARALGYIYARLSLFDEARSYFVMLLEHQECTANDRIMALHVAEQTNDTALIAKIRTLNLKEVSIEQYNKPLVNVTDKTT
ncbi:heme biosynthesis protein HemY [[Haemophilus] ducreyi]|uniref:heme biosynthesis protein HemY n=1 Tax=Haemophilus ducreyi TaxID=730 RepID=UPI000655A4BB|nr:heme biosynthesis protein HemY [[Haemophilus] ducreyi]AKO45808.1 heme biosynthesis protein HemY [[Haemophilus] ducreyi]AKO47195.1 heme biosynthesis protein HemY [[Haemophilus] ducreyi]AKO48558.1 heme biosynthesis protein HemY [[Haemophilus] ducreyi]AKO49929.1 heme biosynthesis protein HemY [[Haemophilus] ducreyi]ANF62361.1 heme biosynthesis protein HemY [[Haemophilus] ducreyi]